MNHFIIIFFNGEVELLVIVAILSSVNFVQFPLCHSNFASNPIPSGRNA